MVKRREFPRPVRTEILNRAKRNGSIHCEGCGLDVTSKPFEIDHIIAENLFLDKSRKLTAADGQLLGACCHRGEDGKTAKDVKIAAKAKRQEGLQFTRPAGKIKSAGFPKAVKPAREQKQMPPRVRSLYEAKPNG
jgi:hypothetical protein